MVFTLAALCCCKKEPADIPEPEIPAVVVPYSVTVEPAPGTRASFNGSSLDSGSYIFAADDQLYVTGANGQISGVLDIETGAGTGRATFTGNLTLSGGIQPTSETIITATLIGASQELFTISNGEITAGPTYPSVLPYTSSISQLVQKYSHFTSSTSYSVHHFTLTQQSVFISFEIDLLKSDLTGTPSTLQVDIKSSDGLTTNLSVTGVPLGGSATIGKLGFTAVFPAGTALQGAKTWVKNSGSDILCSPDFSSTLSLQANNYYRAYRSSVDDFTVEAPSTGIGASVTFNYSPVQYRVCDNGIWEAWDDYDGNAILLGAGDKVSFRGQNSSYTNSSGSTPLITVDNPVYVYGDIMSLMCDQSWGRAYSVPAQGFKQAFKDCTDINIPADKELILSAETLNTSCYEGMFNGCTSLTKTPMLPSTSLAESCYSQMFMGCTSLTSLPSTLLPATTLAELCYNEMFYGCTGLTSLPSGLLPAGTLADMCYHKLFMNCDNLTSLPNGFLPAMNLAFGCYFKMFEDCDKLATVPSTLLPATVLAVGCYARMFYKCKALTRGPDLPAINPAPACYFVMYRNCSSLKYVKCMLSLNATQLAGTTRITGYSDSDDPPIDNLKTWTQSTMWSIFNKWLTSNTAGYTILNNNTCEYVYNENMDASYCAITISGARLIPNKWVCTPAAP